MPQVWDAVAGTLRARLHLDGPVYAMARRLVALVVRLLQCCCCIAAAVVPLLQCRCCSAFRLSVTATSACIEEMELELGALQRYCAVASRGSPGQPTARFPSTVAGHGSRAAPPPRSP